MLALICNHCHFYCWVAFITNPRFVSFAGADMQSEPFLLIGTYYGNQVMFTTSTATAISDSNASTVSIYPNPTSDVVNLSSVDGIKAISITNLSGKTVWSGGASEFPLNISSYAKGIYLVNVVTEGGVKTEKVIVK